MSEELKPCPFCGGTHALTVDNLAGDDWYVECDACKVQQHAIYPTYGAAIAAWNRRADPLAASHQRLKEALSEVLKRIIPGSLASEVRDRAELALKDAP